MESREEQEEDTLSSPLTDSTDTNIQHNDPGTEAATKETTSLVTTSDHHTDEDERVELVKGNSVAEETTADDSADEHGTVKLVKGNGETDGETEGEEEKETGDEVFVLTPTNEASGDGEDIFVFEQKSSTPTDDRPAPPSSLDLSTPKPTKKKVLLAPAISLSLDRRESILSADSEDFPSAFLSPSLDDDDDDDVTDFDLDAMATPSDTESLHFPYDLELEADLRRLGVATPGRPVIRPSNPRAGSNPLNPTPHPSPWSHPLNPTPHPSPWSHPLNPTPHPSPWSSPNSPTNPLNPNPRLGSRGGTEPTGLDLQTEDMVDGQGTRWRCFSTGDPPQDSTVNMSVLEPFLQVLSHGGYYGDSMNDIIVFSSCYLPQNSLENYQYVMDNLFRYVVGTLELMVAENYVIVYFCAGGQKDKLPGIGWLRECYTTIDRRLRKNLKGFFVVHPTWSIKALITIIKPFISSKFSRKLQFVESLQNLSLFIPTEHVQIPHTVSLYDQNLTR